MGDKPERLSRKMRRRKDLVEKKILTSHGGPRQSPKQAQAMMWRAYEMYLSTGSTSTQVAKQLGFSDTYVRDLIRRAKRIMDSAADFDPRAKDLQKEMLKYVPLAQSSLEENLKNAEPRVTVAFLQGVGALVPKQEIKSITAEEELRLRQQTMRAMNPKLKKVLNLDEVERALDVEIQTVDKDKVEEGEE